MSKNKNNKNNKHISRTAFALHAPGQLFDIFDREKISEGPKISFVDVVLVLAVVVLGGESFYNKQKMFAMEKKMFAIEQKMFAIEQKMFAMEQKIFLQQNYGIEMPCVAECGRVWQCMVVCGHVWPFIAVYRVNGEFVNVTFNAQNI